MNELSYILTITMMQYKNTDEDCIFFCTMEKINVVGMFT